MVRPQAGPNCQVNELSSNCTCLICPESFAGLRSRFDHRQGLLQGRLNCRCCFGPALLFSSRTPSGEPVAHYLAGPTWPPGRIWLSPRFLPPCPSGEGCLSRAPPISLLSSLPCGAGCRVRISRILWPVLLLVAYASPGRTLVNSILATLAQGLLQAIQSSIR